MASLKYKPTWRIRASTKREKHSCVMTWSVGGFNVRVRTFNRDAFVIAELVQNAYDAGLEHGAERVVRDVYKALEKHDD